MTRETSGEFRLYQLDLETFEVRSFFTFWASGGVHLFSRISASS